MLCKVITHLGERFVSIQWKLYLYHHSRIYLSHLIQQTVLEHIVSSGFQIQ